MSSTNQKTDDTTTAQGVAVSKTSSMQSVVSNQRTILIKNESGEILYEFQYENVEILQTYQQSPAWDRRTGIMCFQETTGKSRIVLRAWNDGYEFHRKISEHDC